MFLRWTIWNSIQGIFVPHIYEVVYIFLFSIPLQIALKFMQRRFFGLLLNTEMFFIELPVIIPRSFSWRVISKSTSEEHIIRYVNWVFFFFFLRCVASDLSVLNSILLFFYQYCGADVASVNLHNGALIFTLSGPVSSGEPTSYFH